MPSWCACLVSHLVIRTRLEFYIKRDPSLNNDDDDKDVRLKSAKFWMVFCEVTSCCLVDRTKQFRGEEGGNIFLKKTSVSTPTKSHEVTCRRSGIQTLAALIPNPDTYKESAYPCVVGLLLWTTGPDELTLNCGLGWGTINVHGAGDAVSATLEVSLLSQAATLTYIS